MVRLAVRKRPSRSSRFASGQRKTANLRSLSSRNALKKRAAVKKTDNRIEVQKLQTLSNTLSDFIKVRRNKFGANDQVAKKLQAINTKIGQEMRKKTVMNMSLAKQLNQLTPALRGINNVPKTLRSQIMSVKKSLKENAQKDVVRFNTQMKKMLTPMVSELQKLETELQREIKKARSQNQMPKVNPILKQKFATLHRKFIQFKTYWIKHLNKWKLHGSKNTRSSIDQIKKLIDQKDSEFKRNLNILNRYSKSVSASAGKKTHQIFSPHTVKSLETKFNHLNKESVQQKREAGRYFDQLKTAKHI